MVSGKDVWLGMGIPESLAGMGCISRVHACHSLGYTHREGRPPPIHRLRVLRHRCPHRNLLVEGREAKLAVGKQIVGLTYRNPPSCPFYRPISA